MVEFVFIALKAAALDILFTAIVVTTFDGYYLHAK